MSSEDYFYITSTEIRDYLFCPAILYNKYIRKINEPLTEMMRDGKKRFEVERERGKRRLTLLGLKRIKPEKILYSVPVYSKKLCIYGIIDVIYWYRGKAYILEIKESNLTKAPLDHIYQATAYALMAEDTFKTIIHKIIIYYTKSGKYIEKKLTNAMKQYTINIIKEIKEIIKGERIPEIKYKRKCRSCWYNRICHFYIKKKENIQTRKLTKLIKHDETHPLHRR